MGAPAVKYSKAKPGSTFSLLPFPIFLDVWWFAAPPHFLLQGLESTLCSLVTCISRVYWRYLPLNTLLEILLLLVLMLAPLHLTVTLPCYWSKEQRFQMPFLLFSLPFLLQHEFRHLNLSDDLLWVWGWLGVIKQGYFTSGSDTIFLLVSSNKNTCGSNILSVISAHMVMCHFWNVEPL